MAAPRSWKAMIENALFVSRGKDPSAVYVQLATPTPSVRTVVFRGFLGPITGQQQQQQHLAASDNGGGPTNDPNLPVPSREAPRNNGNNGSATSELLTFCTDCRSEKVQELVDGGGKAQVCWWLSVPREQYRLSGRVFVIFPPSHPLYSATTLPSIPFPPSEPNPPSPTLNEVRAFWEAQRLDLWNRIAPGGRASFTCPPPGKPVEGGAPDDRTIWELEDMSQIAEGGEGKARLKDAQELALTRFTMLVMEVDAVDLLVLKGRPQTRVKFARGSGKGEWIATDVNP